MDVAIESSALVYAHVCTLCALGGSVGERSGDICTVCDATIDGICAMVSSPTSKLICRAHQI
jgi:hypothetical protein